MKAQHLLALIAAGALLVPCLTACVRAESSGGDCDEGTIFEGALVDVVADKDVPFTPGDELGDVGVTTCDGDEHLADVQGTMYSVAGAAEDEAMAFRPDGTTTYWLCVDGLVPPEERAAILAAVAEAATG